MTQPTHTEHPMGPEYAMHTLRSENFMQSCIDACSDCHQLCLKTAMNYCLNTGGKHSALT